MPFPEVYTSMKQGVIEGATIDYTALWTTKVYEAVKFVTEPGFHILAEPRPLLISAKFFASQPAEVQRWIAQAGAEAAVYERSLFKERQGKAIEDLRARASSSRRWTRRRSSTPCGPCGRRWPPRTRRPISSKRS